MAGFYQHGNELSSLRSEASTKVSLRIRVLWDVALCLWVCNSLSVPQSLKMKALWSFETSNTSMQRHGVTPEYQNPQHLGAQQLLASKEGL